MTALWNDFNDADDQNSFDLIPKGSVVKVRMTIKPGGYDDFSQGWNGGYATQNQETGSVYLNCEFVVLEGPFARRKLWSLIGLKSPKGPEWTNMGRTFIKGALNSAFGLHPNDNGAQAMQARCITGFSDLDGIELVVKNHSKWPIREVVIVFIGQKNNDGIGIFSKDIISDIILDNIARSRKPQLLRGACHI